MLNKKAVNAAFRVYLSSLLIMLGNHKEKLLKRIDLDENGWIQLWCEIFEYNEEDRARFNQILLPSYQRGGLDGLINAACDSIDEDLAPFSEKMTVITETAVKTGLTKDVSAILKKLV